VAPEPDGRHLRIETGIKEGDEVSIYYDPMIAKLVVWDENRDAALARLGHALARYEIVGPATNVSFLRHLASHPAFAAGEIDTGFIARHRTDLVPERGAPPLAVLAAAALAVLLYQHAAARARAARSADPWSPWHRRDGWRLNGETYQDLRFSDGSAERVLRAYHQGAGYLLDGEGERVTASAERLPDGALALDLDGVRSRVAVVRAGDEVTVLASGESWRLLYRDPLAGEAAEEAAAGRLTAPMPGKIIQVLAKAEERVSRGQALMVLEAMKMEHTIAAPADGVLARVNYAVGDLVEEGAELLAFAEPENT
jgi:3-methylcrotonyl-CoA carboxylase alpha subunit